MIRLKRDNVVKIVDSEYKAARLERQGFERVAEAEPKKPSGRRKEEGSG